MLDHAGVNPDDVVEVSGPIHEKMLDPNDELTDA